MKKILTVSFCDNFIDKLADFIEENYIKKGQDLSRLAIVFGGKRPALFMKRELAKRIKGNFYPPQFFTIDDFVSYVITKKESNTQVVDLNNCYLLYELAKEVAPEILHRRETFAKFLPWAREILQFIDQLDLEMVENKALLNIEANAQIGYDVPADINDLLAHIVALKEAYQKKVREDKIYSRGFEYLRAAELIDECEFAEFDQIIFCNFFYFHKTEEKIVKSLYNRGLATMIFQGDERKWPVLERITKKFGCELKESAEPDKTQFALKLYKGFDTHSQVAVIREILKTIKDTSNTIIVLPSPDSLVPLLSEITALEKEFNISMGYPLKRSSFYSLSQFVFKAQNSRKDSRYYARDYLKALRHPFVKNLRLGEDAIVTRVLIHKIEEILTGKERAEISGSLFFALEEMETLDALYFSTQQALEQLGIKVKKDALRKILLEIHELLFKSWESIRNFRAFSLALDEFLKTFTEKSFLKNYPLNLNIAEKMYAINEEFLNASFSDEEFPQEEIFKIFDSKVAMEMVSFKGSPLKGLQVLGLFETRSLNFENVIVCDTNEGVLPYLKIYEPLIPRDVMISLSLDRLELEEEIQRYQFMRLISSAKNVHLVYQEAKDKEKSRFVEELIWEEQKRTKKEQPFEIQEASFQVKVISQKQVIAKTPEMVKALKKHTYSASSISTYLKDPVEFYYKYVLGLQEQEDLLDEPEARHVGTFVHELLEESYKPFLNKKPKIDAKFRQKFDQLFDERFQDTFARSMKSDAFLLRSVMAERLNRFLDKEETDPDRQVEKILYLENRFEDTLKLSCGDIKFRYVIDRVDKLADGTIMIIDYKTGAIDQMPKAIDKLRTMELSRENILENVRSFQIPLYFHYLHQQFPKESINAALYNLRTLEIKRFLNGKTTAAKEDIDKFFLDCLGFVVSEILNPDIAFERA